MDKIFSTRLDEAVLDELNRVTRRLGVTKRRFLEEAIRLRADQAGTTGDADVWAETLGASGRGARGRISAAPTSLRGSSRRKRAPPDGEVPTSILPPWAVTAL